MTIGDHRHPTVESGVVLQFNEVQHIRNLFGIDVEVDLFDLDLTDLRISFVFVFFWSEGDQHFRDEIHRMKNCSERENERLLAKQVTLRNLIIDWNGSALADLRFQIILER
jgi:hypothetical protein